MAGPSRIVPSDPLPSAQKPEQEIPWPAIAIGAVFILVSVGLFVLVTRGPSRPRNSAPPAYAAQLSLHDINFSQSQNFVGGTVTYMEGTISNSGDRAVTSAEVKLQFKNSLGEVVQEEEQPLKVLTRTGPYPEAIDLRLIPLKPHQSEEFRFTFEHISTDWNQQPPDVRVTDVTLQ
jgi:hypothetical protein